MRGFLVPAATASLSVVGGVFFFPGVFAMAAAVAEVAAEPQFHDVAVRVVPGVTAANAVAAAVGAPLGHDYMTISLSDRLKSWEVIERRLHSALDADLVIAVYNPGSRSRGWQVPFSEEHTEATPI